MTNSDGPPWCKIRALYECDQISVTDLSRRFAISRSTLYRHIRRERWARGGHIQNLPPAKEGQKPAQLQDRPGPDGTDGKNGSALVERLRRVFDRQVSEIEVRLSSLGGANLEERDARTLATLVRTAEKLIELEQQGAGQQDDGDTIDLETLREDLARRLGRSV